jgi:hypothetical protein
MDNEFVRTDAYLRALRKPLAAPPLNRKLKTFFLTAVQLKLNYWVATLGKSEEQRMLLFFPSDEMVRALSYAWRYIKVKDPILRGRFNK